MPAARPLAAVLVLGVLALALFPLVGDGFYVRLLTKVMVLAIFAMSLDLLVGYTGLVSLGHACFFGTGGYVAAALTNHYGIVGLHWLLPASLGASAAAALALGWLSIRAAGIYFIMITLALAQMVYFFFRDVPFWGGADGVNIIDKPVLAFGDAVLLDLGHRPTMYYFTLACLVALYLALATLLRAPFGRTIVGIRINEGRMRALGYPVARYKLAAFVIAGTAAGLAGFLEASRAGFMNPAHLGWMESGLALVIVLLGGMGTLFGPVIGAFTLVMLEDWASGLTERWLFFMGLFVIAVVVFLPNGIGGALRAALERRPRDGAKQAPHAALDAEAEAGNV